MAGALVLGLGSCGEDEVSPNADVAVVAKASLSYSTTAGARTSSAVVLDKFKINIREIEFEYEESESEKESESEGETDTLEDVYEDVKLKGPFEVDLLSGSGAALDQMLTSVSIPNGNFEEIEFKLHKNKETGSSMYGKSVYASGTINGTPFIFWHDTDEEFEIDFEDVNKNIALRGQPLQVIINFNLGLLFDAASGVDISKAVDGDEDGVIEIGPNDEDGNDWLADILKDALEDATDLIDDHKD